MPENTAATLPSNLVHPDIDSALHGVTPINRDSVQANMPVQESKSFSPDQASTIRNPYFSSEQLPTVTVPLVQQAQEPTPITEVKFPQALGQQETGPIASIQNVSQEAPIPTPIRAGVENQPAIVQPQVNTETTVQAAAPSLPKETPPAAAQSETLRPAERGRRDLTLNLDDLRNQRLKELGIIQEEYAKTKQKLDEATNLKARQENEGVKEGEKTNPVAVKIDPIQNDPYKELREQQKTQASMHNETVISPEPKDQRVAEVAPKTEIDTFEQDLASVDLSSIKDENKPAFQTIIDEYKRAATAAESADKKREESKSQLKGMFKLLKDPELVGALNTLLEIKSASSHTIEPIITEIHEEKEEKAAIPNPSQASIDESLKALNLSSLKADLKAA